MSRMHKLIASGSLLIVMGVMQGCEKREPAPTSQPAEPACTRADHPYNRQFDQSSENADMVDMVVTDIHFMPNRAILNGTGTARLHRLAWIVDHYGGTIAVDVTDGDENLTQARIQTVKAYLRACGLADSKIQVALGLSSGKGMPADEAINVYNDTRYKTGDTK